MRKSISRLMRIFRVLGVPRAVLSSPSRLKQEVPMKMAMMAMMVLAVGAAGCAGSGNGGATGAAPERYMAERANVNGTYNAATSSSTMLEQRIKQDSANGASSGGGNTPYRSRLALRAQLSPTPLLPASRVMLFLPNCHRHRRSFRLSW